MTEVISNGPVLQEVVSQLVEKINQVSDALVSVLERSADQVSTYSAGTVGGLMHGSSLLLTDQVIHYLKRLKFHLQELTNVLEHGNHDYDVTSLVQMLAEKDSELEEFMSNNVNFHRSYGWYVKQEIRPLFTKNISRVSIA